MILIGSSCSSLSTDVDFTRFSHNLHAASFAFLAPAMEQVFGIGGATCPASCSYADSGCTYTGRDLMSITWPGRLQGGFQVSCAPDAAGRAARVHIYPIVIAFGAAVIILGIATGAFAGRVLILLCRRIKAPH